VPTPDGAVDEATKAAVLAGYEHYLAGVAACGADPRNCNADLFTVPGSLANMLLREGARFMADRNLVAEQGPTKYDVLALGTSEHKDSYALEVCWTDSAVVTDTRGTPAASDDQVVNDEIVSVRTRWTLAHTDSGWRVSIPFKLSEARGDSCAAS
jgi:hypothetical protein